MLGDASSPELLATDWERIARVQNAKLMAVCDEPGGFEKLCEVMDRYRRVAESRMTSLMAVENILKEYGMEALDFVNEFAIRSRMPAPVHMQDAILRIARETHGELMRNGKVGQLWHDQTTRQEVAEFCVLFASRVAAAEHEECAKKPNLSVGE